MTLRWCGRRCEFAVPLFLLSFLPSPSHPRRPLSSAETYSSRRHLFLSSRIDEAQEICLSQAHRLYFSVGYSLITSIKALATFEPDDLETAIQCCRDSITIAHLLRKKDHGLFERVGSITKGSTSVHSIKTMSLVQRHAELVFAECTLLKVRLFSLLSLLRMTDPFLTLFPSRRFLASSTGSNSPLPLL